MLSVILPAREEPYLPILIKNIQKFKGIEILIQTEKGLGYAVRKGIQKAKGDKIIVMDSDGQHNPNYIPKMVNGLDNSSMVIGSRYIKDGEDENSLHRRIISRVMAGIVRLNGRTNGLKDPLSGYFGFRKELLDGIKLECDGFKIGLEILQKTKVKAKEIPIVFERRKMGKSKGNFKELINLVILICK